jgi:ribosomal protein L3
VPVGTTEGEGFMGTFRFYAVKSAPARHSTANQTDNVVCWTMAQKWRAGNTAVKGCSDPRPASRDGCQAR